jgi:trehalose-6-phosphatase
VDIPERVSSRTVYDGRVLTIRVDEVRLASGHDAVREVVSEAGAAAALYAGDDLGDLAAFEAMSELAEQGVLTLRVGVIGPEAPAALRDHVDLCFDGPLSLVAWLRSLVGGGPHDPPVTGRT